MSEDRRSVPGYIRAFHGPADQRYRVRFYAGFARVVALAPPGETNPVTLYTQPSGTVLEVGEEGPQRVSTLTVTGPDLEVEVEVDDTPQDGGTTGPIRRLRIEFQSSGTPWPGNEYVRPVTGADRIRGVEINPEETLKSVGGGGVTAFQQGGGSLTVDNDTDTCPHDCGDPPE